MTLYMTKKNVNTPIRRLQNDTRTTQFTLTKLVISLTQRVSKFWEVFPNLTPCDYFLWGSGKDKVFVPSQPVI